MDEEIYPLLSYDSLHCSLDDLPNEILEKILGYSGESFNSTIKVSKKFRELTYLINFSFMIRRINNFSFPHYWVTDIIHSLDRIIAINRLMLDGDYPEYINKIDLVGKAAEAVSWSPIFRWFGGIEKYGELIRYRNYSSSNWITRITLSWGRDPIVFSFMIFLLLLWSLILGLVLIPHIESEYSDIQHWLNSTNLGDKLDAREVNCYFHNFTLRCGNSIFAMHIFCDDIATSPKIQEIFNQFPSSHQEYLQLIENITSLILGNANDLNSGPLVVNYSFNSNPLNLKIITYRIKGWYIRDYLAEYSSLSCLISRGKDKYYKLTESLMTRLVINCLCFILGICWILYLVVYNIMNYRYPQRLLCTAA